MIEAKNTTKYGSSRAVRSARYPGRIGPLLAVVIWGNTILPAFAQVHANPYQALSDALRPFVNLIVSDPASPERAMRGSVRLVSMTGLPEEFRGTRIGLALQYPDRWMLAGDLIGESAAVARVGEKVWVAPGQKVEYLIGQIKNLPPRDASFRLGPFESPIPEKQLVWFPVLFKIEGSAKEDLDGTPCLNLDLRLAPELAKSLKAEDWTARLWIGPDGKVVQMAFSREGWSVTLRFESLEFARRLPAETWAPPPALASDVLWLDGPRVKQLLDVLGREIARRQ